MKSSIKQLKNRGYIDSDDLEGYKALDKPQLLDLLNSHEPQKRTASVRLLSDQNVLDEQTLQLFLQLLVKEKKLYTKIELCNALQKGGIKSAQFMVNYLGQIGNNGIMVKKYG